MDKKNLTCINCPLGCSISVELKEGKVISVSGNSCKRGEIYARKEMTNPTRIVTSTVRIAGRKGEMLSVKTKEGIPQSKIQACIKVLSEIEVIPPIYTGDVVVKNIVETGIDVIATKNIH